MFCRNCGNQLPEGALFCNACGTKVEAPAQPAPEQPVYNQQPAPEQPAYTQPVYTQPQTNPDVEGAATGSLVFGILSLALGGILGIIFGKIAQNKANEFQMMTGELTGKAKVGNILGRIGVPVGIATLVFYVIYIIALLAAM